MNQDESFTPDTVDEQIDRVASTPPQGSLPPQEQVIQRLHTLYQADQQSTERVWGRLAQRLSGRDAGTQTASKPSLLINEPRKERKQPMHPALHSIRRTGSPRLAQVAAVIFAVLLVGSLLLVLHMAQSARTGANRTPQTGALSTSPHGIYISRSDGVYRLDIQTRKVIWHTHVAGQSLYAGDPVVIGDTVYIVTDSWVSALNAQTGALRWSHDFQGRMEDPYMDNGLLYFSTIPPLSAAIYTVNPATGAIVATYTPKYGVSTPAATPVAHSSSRPKPGWSAPIVVDGVLYYVAGSNNATLYAVQLPGQKLIWQQQLSNQWLFILPGGIIVQNSVAYVEIMQGGPPIKGWVDAFAARTGSKLWQSPVSGNTVRTVVITNTMIYIASSSGELQVFDVHTHTLVWQKSLNAYWALAGSGMLYIDSGLDNSSQIVALNATTGQMLWQQSNSHGLVADDVLNSVVYGESWSNGGKGITIYAFNADNGTQLWMMSIEVPNVQWGGITFA
jgi:outer membrane protein assembly factor BamB